MNFLTAAKELKEAQAQLAEKDAALTAANAELAKLKADNDAAAALLTEVTGKLDAAESQLKAANETVAKLEAEAKEAAAKIDKVAATKAAQVVASVGHEPVKSDTAPTKASIKEIYAAMKPGPERDAFRKKHPEHFSLN